ncbi:MAG: hypothetical protein IJW35_06375 [Lentisphaeria bacterium]|nr:hypothetical protein [Lentisphaeria bacterium]
MEQFLKPAIRAEKKGVGIFYFDENKASKYTAYSNKIGNIPTGFVHNIAEAGLNVKSQTETLQFKRWFADSKVVDQNGEPLVVYHGSSAVFYAFDPKKIKSGAFGKGIYLSPSKANARAYGSNVMALYAKIAKPYIIKESLGFTAGDFKSIQQETALQIHRFYIAMQYGEGIYGVEMTVREKRNGATVFYTLEAHDLDIQKINPETESSRGGVAKAALPGRSPAIKFSTFFEKFNPSENLFGFKYKEKYPQVRFSLREFDGKLLTPDPDHVKMMRTIATGKSLDPRGKIQSLKLPKRFQRICPFPFTIYL